jgi:UDP-N-acetylglucosamine 2-epimerase
MSKQFFDQLGLPVPDYNLGVNGGSHGDQTGRMLIQLDQVLKRESPDLVVVYGDTNSTLAGALSAAKQKIPVAHVEAGLRCYDRRMPEEINRVLVDHLSTLLFCPTKISVANLKMEGLNGVLVGDVMLDALLKYRENDTIIKRLGLSGYYLATVHREENTDSPQRLARIIKGLNALDLPVVMPLHPRTRQAIKHYEMDAGKILLIDPVGYAEMSGLTSHARRVFTDSGGLQKEAYWLGVPCSTFRSTSEIMETIESGWNVLVDDDPILIQDSTYRKTPAQRPAILGEPGASRLIAKSITDFLG